MICFLLFIPIRKGWQFAIMLSEKGLHIPFRKLQEEK